MITSLRATLQSYESLQRAAHAFATTADDEALWTIIQSIPGFIEMANDESVMTTSAFQLIQQDCVCANNMSTMLDLQQVGDNVPKFIGIEAQSENVLRAMKFVMDRFKVRCKDVKNLCNTLKSYRLQQQKREKAREVKLQQQKQKEEAKLEKQRLALLNLPAPQAVDPEMPSIFQFIDPTSGKTRFSEQSRIQSVAATTIELGALPSPFDASKAYRVTFGSGPDLIKAMGGKPLSQFHDTAETSASTEELVKLADKFHTNVFSASWPDYHI